METILILVVDDAPTELADITAGLKQRLSAFEIDASFEIQEDTESALDRLRATNRFDLVLLDMEGVEWEDFLRQFRGTRPYLPVAMLSRNLSPHAIVQCVDAGARSFIFKNDFTLPGVDSFTAVQAKQDQVAWDNAAGTIRRLVSEYRPIKRLQAIPLPIGVITKAGDPGSVIPDQIEFLSYVQEIPDLKNHFPALSRAPWKQGNRSFYEMPFYSLTPLRRVIFDEIDQEICIDSASRDLSEVMHFAFNSMYRTDVRAGISEKYLGETYWGKLKTRVNEAIEAATAPPGAPVSTLASGYIDLLQANRIDIGGQDYQSPVAVLEELGKDREFLAAVKPPRLCLIHGDLHFDNILVDDRLKRREAFKLVDPRGFKRPGYANGAGDPAYDFGKLLHSAHGYYDLIHKGAFAVDATRLKSQSRIVTTSPLTQHDWESAPQGGGGSGDPLTTHKRYVQPWVRSAFDDLWVFLIDWVVKHEVTNDDPTFLLRAYLHEALHFCTMGKFHLKIGDDNSLARAISLHVRGIELMNEFRDRWNSFRTGDQQARLQSDHPRQRATA